MAVSIPPKGDAAKKVGAHFTPLQVSAQTTPNMTVRVEPGAFWTAQREFVEYSGGSSPTITAPGSDAKLVVIGIDDNAAINVIDGTVSTSPDLPTIPEDVLPLAFVFVASTTTSITGDAIFDIRPLWHLFPEAIADLQSELDDRPTFSDLTSSLATKADTTGTPSATWTLNNDHTGVPTLDGELIVERGALPDVSIRWNEASDVWEFTNDGSTFFSIGASAGDFYTKAQLDGGVLDSRYYTETEADALFASISHTHTSGDITDFVAAVTALFSTIALDDLGDVTLTLPADTEVLMFDGGSSEWVNKTVSLEDLGDVALTAPTTDHILIHNGGTDFVNALLEKDLISDWVETDFVHTTGVESIAGSKTFTDDMTVSADLDVTGDITGLSLALNSGEITISTDTGAGADAGIEIDRGASPNALLFFDETSDAWLIGVEGDVGTVLSGAHTHTSADITDFTSAVDAIIASTDLDALADVAYPISPVAGHYLKYSGTDWEPVLPVAADVSDFGPAVVGALSAASVGDLGDVVLTAPSTSEVLRFDGADWVNASLVKADISDFVESDFVHTTGAEVIAGSKTFSDAMILSSDLTVGGDLTVNGTVTTVNSTTVTVTDNVMILNNGEVGAGVTNLIAGIQVDRGTLTDATLLFNETTGVWEADSVEISLDGHTHVLSDITDVTVTATEVNFLNGVTSDVQTQIDGKADTVPGVAGNIAELDGTGQLTDSGVATSSVSLTGHTHVAADVTDFDSAADARIAAASIDDLSDVAITLASTGEVLRFDGANWVDATLVAADVSDFDSAADARIAAASIDDVSDVVLTGVADGDFLLWDTGKFENRVFATEVNTLIGAASIDDLSDVAITAASTGEVLRFDGANWVDATLVAADVSDFDSAADARIAAASIDDLSDVSVPTPTSGDFLQFDGANWADVVLTKSLVTDFTETDFVHTFGAESIAGVKTFSDNAVFSADVQISGDLTVLGTTTAVNTTNIEVEDKNIFLNSGYVGPSSGSDGAGLTVERSADTDASLVWDDSAERWKGGEVGSEVQFKLVTDNNHPDYELVSWPGGAVHVASFTFSAPAGGKTALQVFRNGIKQIEGATKHYTITPPSTITFNVGSEPAPGDDVEFYGFG